MTVHTMTVGDLGIEYTLGHTGCLSSTVSTPSPKESENFSTTETIFFVGSPLFLCKGLWFIETSDGFGSQSYVDLLLIKLLHRLCEKSPQP